MYDDKDYDTILKEMRARVSGGIGKGEGTLVNFALAPAAAEIEEVYFDMEVADMNGSILTCDREHLIVFGAENNIPVKTATHARWLAEFNTEINEGDRFEAEDLTYTTTGRAEDGRYYLKCETPGTAGNVKPDDELLPVEFIEGYETGELVELVEAAEEDEETETYRTRLLETRRQENAISGNRADYKKFIKGLPGVGGIKQERVTKEHRRIRTYIISSAWGKPDRDTVEKVQQAVDPRESQGEGEGKAPFFHVVDILPVETQTININSRIELMPGYSFTAVLPDIGRKIDQYFTELNRGWEETKDSGLTVRLLKIADAITAAEGVVDARNTTLNGAAENVELGRNTIPVRGEITNAD